GATGGGSIGFLARRPTPFVVPCPRGPGPFVSESGAGRHRQDPFVVNAPRRFGRFRGSTSADRPQTAVEGGGRWTGVGGFGTRSPEIGIAMTGVPMIRGMLPGGASVKRSALRWAIGECARLDVSVRTI